MPPSLASCNPVYGLGSERCSGLDPPLSQFGIENAMHRDALLLQAPRGGHGQPDLREPLPAEDQPRFAILCVGEHVRAAAHTLLRCIAVAVRLTIA